MRIRKIVLFLYVLQICFLLVSKNSIIILYGCSSAGKTSIARELLKILPGKWQYVPANRFVSKGGNLQLWQSVNKACSSGSNIIVDTHNLQFLIDDVSAKHVMVVLLYCSPEKLIEHVLERNGHDNAKDHRKLKKVFQEYCQKFKAVGKDQVYIDTLSQKILKNKYGFFVTFALKRIIKKFFNSNGQTICYVAALLPKYDCFINTGTTSIAVSAAQIKEQLMQSMQQ